MQRSHTVGSKKRKDGTFVLIHQGNVKNVYKF